VLRPEIAGSLVESQGRQDNSLGKLQLLGWSGVWAMRLWSVLSMITIDPASRAMSWHKSIQATQFYGVALEF
jgi:hypothetical protein